MDLTEHRCQEILNQLVDSAMLTRDAMAATIFNQAFFAEPDEMEPLFDLADESRDAAPSLR